MRPAATGAAAGGKHAEGVKQEEIGKRIGWSRGKVSQHASLEKIDKQAWKKIATNFSSQCSRGNNDDVAENATNVANIFSEGLLRDIIQLTPAATSRRARGRELC